LVYTLNLDYPFLTYKEEELDDVIPGLMQISEYIEEVN